MQSSIVEFIKKKIEENCYVLNFTIDWSLIF